MRSVETTLLSDESRSMLSRRQSAALAVIFVAGFVLRLAYLVQALRTPGFAWEDSDGYIRQALALAGNGDTWRWTFDATIYTYNAQQYVLPPMYAVFLSVFALFPNFPLSAEVAQVVLASIATLLVFELGRVLHSASTGLVSAGAYALWVPNIFNVWSTSQETLYLPLILLAFVVLSRATVSRALKSFGFAGLLFGLAALTRSMPLFFILPASALYALLAADRRRSAREALMFVAGFLLVVIPYSVALSNHFGQLIIIDSHGSVHLIPGDGGEAPDVLETAASVAREILTHPLGYINGALELTRSLLHVNGGRILQIYVVAPSELQAVCWKVLVHVGTDAHLFLSTLLAGIGAALSRRPRIAALLLLWAAVNVGITTFGGFGGARLRVPFEPILMTLAAVCLSGRWQWRGTLPLLAGAALGVLAALLMVPQVPRSLRAWPDYGIRWPSIFARGAGTFEGRAGFNVLAQDHAGDNVVVFQIASAETASPTRVDVRTDGVLVRTIAIDPGETRMVRFPSRHAGLAFVELDTVDPGREPQTLQVLVPDR